MAVNTKLLPIKLHFFFFMGALGPILPQLPLFGKDLGISAAVMGTITGILSFTFLLMKPLFGLSVDVFRQYRKSIFEIVILVMTLSFGGIYFILAKPTSVMTKLDTYSTQECYHFNQSFFIRSNSTCLTEMKKYSPNFSFETCVNCSSLVNTTKCKPVCFDDPNLNSRNFYESFTFWTFIMFMSVGTIGFNVVNSLSDAICFDVVEKQENYGNQRLWGSIGFGLTGLLSGYLTDIFSTDLLNYAPAFVIMIIFSVIDLAFCTKLQLPIIETPKNIFKDLRVLLADKRVVTFVVFTVLAGILDSVIIYFLFWYIEDLAVQTHTDNVKLIEGLILAAETLGAEVLFFSISGRILEYLGHVHCFTLCFLNYFLRLVLIALVPTPWWFLPVELLMQGPTFALTYTTIVAYADKLAPPGLSATMQGIASGMADGTGYALGSIGGGFCYRLFGGKISFGMFAGLALICAVSHFVLHRTLLKNNQINKNDYEILP